MSYLTVLRGYAQRSDPTNLPLSILFTHNDHTMTVFDAYPKAIFHFLVLPRIVAPFTADELKNLRTLLACPKEKARGVLDKLQDEAKHVRDLIEEEMLKRYGFKWEIWTGFHAVPSMEHLHLHVISTDLCSPALKTKRHYNSFHPKLGFFLHVEDVLSWFEAVPSYFSRMSKLKASEYEPTLKEDLHCWRCSEDFRNMPLLKVHLQKEWETEEKREKARLERKKKRAKPDTSTDDDNDKTKRHRTDSPLATVPSETGEQ